MKIGSISFQEHVDIRAALCFVTPNDAANLLQRNKHNRKMRQNVVEKYSKEMLAGEWYPSASGIGFDTDGLMLDGQHRLQAIVDSKSPQWMLLVVNLPHATQEKTDRHGKRSLVDCFALSGVITRGAIEVSTATVLARRAAGATSKRNSSVSDVDVKAALNAHRDGIQAVLQALATVSNTKGMTRAGVMAAFVHGYEINNKSTLDFISRFISGEMMTNDQPPMRLRKSMLENTSHMSGGTFQMLDYEKASCALRAWYDGKTINALRLGYSLDDHK